MKVPVLLYLYHIEIWDEIFHLLLPIKDLIVLDISIVKGKSNPNILSDLKNFELLKYREVENKGVDIAPFLFQINELSDTYPFFIKIHSKISLIKNFNWRIVLLHTILGSRKIFLDNIKQITETDNIGAIVDEHMIMNNMGHNQKYIDKIADILNVDASSLSDFFMAGNIFIGKTQLFKKYITSDFIDKIYPLLETGSVKDEEHGTYCHAMERFFGKIIHLEKHIIQDTRPQKSFTIYSSKFKNNFNIYQCYNNYCYSYNDNDLGIVYGKLFYTNDKNIIVMNWNYLSNSRECWKKYSKNKNNIWI
jgi:hypothetical protein